MDITENTLLYKFSEDLNERTLLIAAAGLGTLGLLALLILNQGRATKTVTNITDTLTQITNNTKSSTSSTKKATTTKAKTTAAAATKTTLSSILKKAAKYDYERGTGKTTAAKLKQYGRGDCWAMSDYLYNEIKAAKFKVREIQYITTSSLRHRTIQVYSKNKKRWVDLPYKEYGFKTGFRKTTFKPGMFVRRQYLGAKNAS